MSNKKISDYSEQTSPASGMFHLIEDGSSYKKVNHSNLLEGLTTDDLADGVSTSTFTNEKAQDAIGSAISNSGNDVNLSYDDASNTFGANIATLTNFSQNDLVSGTEAFQVKYLRFDIDHAQILTLNTTNVVLDFPTNENSILIPIAFLAFTQIATSGYTNNGIQLLDRTTNDVIAEWSSNLLSTSSDTYATAYLPTSSARRSLNTDLKVTAVSSDPSGGNAANRLSFLIAYILTPDIFS